MKPCLFIVALCTFLPSLPAHGWSEPHLTITRAAVAVLPQWQRDFLGAEAVRLGDDYCLIPDHVFTDKENAKFAAMESKPGEVYLTGLHLPAQQPENLETLRYFMSRAVAAVSERKAGDAARYMGTVCHMLEDFGSPAHTVPGDNMFTLLQQFLPASEGMKDQLMHGPIESGEISVDIKGWQPALLGVTVEEAAWRLLHRVHEGIINARGTTIPIIQALYADDREAVVRHQLRAATLDAKIVADAFHTILCLGMRKFDAGGRKALDTVPIGSFWPLEAENLYFPQKQFFSSPYWGHPRSGVMLEGGKKAVPIVLRVEQQPGVIVEKTFADGISAGMGRPLTYLLPAGVFRRFTVFGGLHPRLGAKGRVEFTITGDGRTLATAVVAGNEPAHSFDCDVSAVARLQLALTPRGLDSKSNYAAWAAPLLVK